MERTSNTSDSKFGRPNIPGGLWVTFFAGLLVALFAGSAIFTPNSGHDSIWEHALFLGGLTVMLLSAIRLVVDSADLEERRDMQQMIQSMDRQRLE